MLDLMRDLFRHEAWADARHLGAILALPAAAADPEILERLHHYHTTQAWYLEFFRGAAPALGGLPEEPRPAIEAARSIEAYHRGIERLLDGLGESRLQTVLRFPTQEALEVTMLEAMLQVVTHSQHHRGQNARRLRELGAEPPATDFLVWVLKGRPKPAWPAA